MREEERTTCEITCFFGVWGGFISALMCLLMKGLKAAVAVLKEEIVVSDKV